MDDSMNKPTDVGGGIPPYSPTPPTPTPPVVNENPVETPEPTPPVTPPQVPPVADGNTVNTPPQQ